MEETHNVLSIERVRSKALKDGLIELKEALNDTREEMFEISREEKIPLPSRVVDGTFRFHPVVYLNEEGNLVLANHVEDLSNKVCWGFCGPNQRAGAVHSGIDGRICDFIPYSPEAARVCNESLKKGLKSWTITAPNKTKYLVEEISNGTFKQTNQTNKSLIRSVIRTDFDTAKRLVVERILKSEMGQEKAPLLYPLLNGNLWRKGGFPVSQYDELFSKGKFANDSYINVLEQMKEPLEKIEQIEVPNFNASYAYTLLYTIGLKHKDLETASVEITF